MKADDSLWRSLKGSDVKHRRKCEMIYKNEFYFSFQSIFTCKLTVLSSLS